MRQRRKPRAHIYSFVAISLALLAAPNLARAATPPADSNWPAYGGDLSNSRYADLDQITPKNASRLKVAWIFHTGVLGAQTSLETSPVVFNGVVYVTSGHDDVFALDATTGSTLWAYHPSFLVPLGDLSLCCGEVNRGVAYGSGRIFLARLDGVLDALDARNGKLLWETQVVDFNAHYSLTMAPQFVRDAVLVGSSGGEYEDRGQVAAYDAHSGKMLWKTYTTAPGQSWAELSWEHGGGNVWQTPAVDPSLGLVFVDTGNAGSDVNGSRRAGDNRYTSSILALDFATGRIAWGFQEVHHDMWDYDAAQPVVLFDLERGGHRYAALGHCGKNGNYYILNRRTGEPIYPVTERRVTTNPRWQNAAATQPFSSVEPLTPLSFLPGTIDFSKLPRRIMLAPQYTPPQEQPVLVEPGDDGGCEMAPAAFSPRTGYVY